MPFRYNAVIKIPGRLNVKAPKGFGKRYFSLASVQAHSVAPKLLGLRSCLTSYARTVACERESEDDPPETPPEATECLVSDKPCHCDRYFRRRTTLTLRACRKKSACNCNCRFYSFRRTGVHPPTVSFFSD